MYGLELDGVPDEHGVSNLQEGGRVLSTEMLSPRIARQGTVCQMSI